MQEGLLNTVGDAAAKSSSADILIIFLIFVMYIFVSNPMVCIVLLAVFGDKIKADILVGFLGGIFVGSVCCLFFTAFAQVVLNSTDVIFYCFALEQETGHRQPRFSQLYESIENFVVGVPIADGEGHAKAVQGRPNQQYHPNNPELGGQGVVMGTPAKGAGKGGNWPAGKPQGNTSKGAMAPSPQNYGQYSPPMAA